MTIYSIVPEIHIEGFNHHEINQLYQVVVRNVELDSDFVVNGAAQQLGKTFLTCKKAVAAIWEQLEPFLRFTAVSAEEGWSLKRKSVLYLYALFHKRGRGIDWSDALKLHRLFTSYNCSHTWFEMRRNPKALKEIYRFLMIEEEFVIEKLDPMALLAEESRRAMDFSDMYLKKYQC